MVAPDPNRPSADQLAVLHNGLFSKETLDPFEVQLLRPLNAGRDLPHRHERRWVLIADAALDAPAAFRAETEKLAVRQCLTAVEVVRVPCNTVEQLRFEPQDDRRLITDSRGLVNLSR
jgi:hypothetical protein